jgi:ABC-type enterochelin transport system substrate-binding protein
LIIKQISAAKSNVLRYLDEIEERLITEVGSVQEKNEEKINREKLEICQLKTSSTAYNIMLTTEITNLNVCVYFTVYLRRWWYS